MQKKKKKKRNEPKNDIHQLPCATRSVQMQIAAALAKTVSVALPFSPPEKLLVFTIFVAYT